MSNQGQGLLSHFYPGFVCFVLILTQMSGERLQDHWSCGSTSFFLLFFKKTCARHSLYLPGGSRPQYGRHIYVSSGQGSNPRPPDQTAKALTTDNQVILYLKQVSSFSC